MKTVRSHSWKLKNAVVTLHGWSAGTAVLNVTTTGDNPGTISVWVSPEELNELADVLRYNADTVCRDQE